MARQYIDVMEISRSLSVAQCVNQCEYQIIGVRTGHEGGCRKDETFYSEIVGTFDIAQFTVFTCLSGLTDRRRPAYTMQWPTMDSLMIVTRNIW